MILDFAKSIIIAAKSTSQYYFYPFIVLTYLLGRRPGEILSLTWNDIKLDRIIFRDTKSGDDKIIPISESIYKFIMQLPRIDIYVIATRQRKSDTFRKTWSRLQKELKLDGQIKHLRHSFGTNLAQEGIDLITIQNLLGHADIKTTMVYSQTSMDQMKNATDKIFLGTNRTHDLLTALPKIPSKLLE